MGHIHADVEAQLCILGWNYIVIVVIRHNGTVIQFTNLVSARRFLCIALPSDICRFMVDFAEE